MTRVPERAATGRSKANRHQTLKVVRASDFIFIFVGLIRTLPALGHTCDTGTSEYFKFRSAATGRLLWIEDAQ